MDDLISRNEAYNTLTEYYHHRTETQHEALKEALGKVPSAEKKGKWIKKSKPLDFCTMWWYECSECGSKPPNDRYGHCNYLTGFCPNCGADMRGEE